MVNRDLQELQVLEVTQGKMVHKDRRVLRDLQEQMEKEDHQVQQDLEDFK